MRLTPADIKGLNETLDLKGRIDEENWTGQAQILATGGETYYSRRRDRGVPMPDAASPAAPVPAAEAAKPAQAASAPAQARAVPPAPAPAPPGGARFCRTRGGRCGSGTIAGRLRGPEFRRQRLLPFALRALGSARRQCARRRAQRRRHRRSEAHSRHRRADREEAQLARHHPLRAGRQLDRRRHRAHQPHPRLQGPDRARALDRAGAHPGDRRTDRVLAHARATSPRQRLPQNAFVPELARFRRLRA